MPDVCLYRWERVPRDETGALENDAQTPPDLAIEIASPRQSRPSLRRRCQWYVEHGVGAALLVDDRDETIRVFRPGEAARTYRGPDRIDLDDVIPGLHIVVEEIFAALRLE